MGKSRFKKLVSVLASVLFLLLTSCLQKSEAALSSEDTQTANDQERYESYLYDADDMVDLALNAQKELTGKPAQKAKVPPDDRFSCAALSLAFAEDYSKDYPQGTLWIDFGDACNAKGKTRQGKISVEFRGNRFEKDSYIKYKFDKYAIQDVVNKVRVTLEGERQMIVTQAAKNPDYITVTMSVSLKDGKAAWGDNTFMTLAVQQVREWRHYAEHANYDQWKITGSSNGTTRRNKSFSSVIADPLLYDINCIRGDIRVYLPTQGKMNLTVGNDPTITFDFGSGACDPQFTISKNGVTAEVNPKAN
ncbi:MAG: hypothetical protein CRN43_16135 [Candidatus Nephrothrix sp. EaCA]|nr:MAG: hypothetical protein CRN43_16135 [Candidatus Nephrothrix sp. EaCA]